MVATLKTKNITLDLARRETLVRGKAVHLTYTEFEILRTLMNVDGAVCSRDILSKSLASGSDPRTVDQHVSRIRRKIGCDCIVAVTRLGFKIARGV